jgi:hypothetical protein
MVMQVASLERLLLDLRHKASGNFQVVAFARLEEKRACKLFNESVQNSVD